VIFPAGDRHYGNARAAPNTGSNTAVSEHVVDKLQRRAAWRRVAPRAQDERWMMPPCVTERCRWAASRMTCSSRSAPWSR